MATIDCLPTEILQHIFTLVHSYYQPTISEVCRRWDDAVQHSMMKSLCLKVSVITWPEDEEEEREGSSTSSRGRMQLIGKRILQRTKRKYSCLEVEWRPGETARYLRLLKERLDVCQERFPGLERLFLKVPADGTLVRFFDDRRDWVRNLTELDVNFSQMGPRESDNPTECEILLPNLKQLCCMKSTDDANFQGGRLEGSYVFTLNAPELRWLTVEMNEGFIIHQGRQSRFLEPDVCCLFLPTLKLKSVSKLEKLEMERFTELNQRHIDNSEQFLKNLKVLELTRCTTEVAVKIWKKCLNLKELSIWFDTNRLSPTMMHVSPAMSRTLEKLTLATCWLQLDRHAVFPNLKHITLDLLLGNSASDAPELVAPQLISLSAMWTKSSQLMVRHKEQIRTMEVTMGHWIMTENPPPSNVTELLLRWPDRTGSEPIRVVQDYLAYFPNLQRLRIYGRDFYSLHFPEINELPMIAQLQSLFAYQFSLRLSDLKKFTGLKSLHLSQCIIKAQPSDDDAGEVILPALEYCRADRVAVESFNSGGEDSIFPIRVDGRHSPQMDMIHVTAKGRKVFNSTIGGVQYSFNVALLPKQF